MLKRIKRLGRKIDLNIVLQAIFCAIAILCSFAACFVDFSVASLLNALKDAFSTAMVFVVFFVAVNHFKKTHKKRIDKLDYLDNWEENKEEIFTCEDIVPFTKHLLYGIQAATYTYEDTKKLYNRIGYILENGLCDDKETESVLRCAQAVLEVFVKTKRLTRGLDEKGFLEVMEKLRVPYEDKVKDPDMAAWCEIMRNDKMELSLEWHARELHDKAKADRLEQALEACKHCIALLDKQVANNQEDVNFALLYRAYINRNISKIYGALNELQPNSRYAVKEKQFCAMTLNNRKQLYSHYQKKRKIASLTKDYISQEYILALVEYCTYENDPDKKKALLDEGRASYLPWKEQNDTRNMLLKQIEEAINHASKEEVSVS